MGFVILAVLVVLVVGGLVIYKVLAATDKSGAGTRDYPDVRDADDAPGGTRTRAMRSDDPDAAAHVGRPGEGEGREQVEFEGEQPPAAGPRSER
jgi:hypothetical protein